MTQEAKIIVRVKFKCISFDFSFSLDNFDLEQLSVQDLNRPPGLDILPFNDNLSIVESVSGLTEVLGGLIVQINAPVSRNLRVRMSS